MYTKLKEKDIAAHAPHASSGRALRGIKIPFLKEQHPVAEHFLIDPPSDLKILGISQPAIHNTYCFSGTQQFESFYNDVKEKGWTAAISIHVNSILGQGSIGISVGENKSKTELKASGNRMSEAFITECVYAPMASFQISANRKRIKLSEPALMQARGIKSDADADKFLKDFHPFVFTSTYHLGGVFFRQFSVTCEEETTLCHIMDLVKSHKSGSAQLESRTSEEVLGEVSESSKLQNSSSNQDAFNKQKIQQNTIVLGAKKVNTADEFTDTLEWDYSRWAIIDSNINNENSTLLSVWDLVLKHSNAESLEHDAIALKRAAKLLCQRWIINTPYQDSGDQNLINLIIDAQMFLCKLSGIPSQSSSTKPPPASDHLVDSSIDGILEYLIRVLEQFSTSTKPIMEDVRESIRNFINDHEFSEDNECREASFVLQTLCECHSGDNITVVKALAEVIQDLEKLKSPGGDSSAGRSASNEPLRWPKCQEPTVNVRSQARDDTFCFHYAGDLVADKNFYDDQKPHVPHLPDSQSNNSQWLPYAARRYIDCLRHRVNPAQHLVKPEKTRRSLINRSTSSDVSSTRNNKLGVFSPLELLIYIFQHSDLPTIIEICRLLLLQRASTLLVFPLNRSISHDQASHKHYAKQLWHCIDALWFVSVPIENERNLCIAEDVSLLRLVFISEKQVQKSHSATLATRILHCEFVSQNDLRGMGQYMEQMLLHNPVIEVAVGFVRGEDGNHTTYIALHVTGSYVELLDFIEATADVVILELEQDQSCSPHWPRLKKMEKKFTKVLQWKETTPGEGYDEQNKVIWGQESFLVQEIGLFLTELPNLKETKSTIRRCLGDECAKYFYPGNVTNFKENVEDVLDNSALENMRENLKLQKSLEIEAQAFFESLKLKDNPEEKHDRERKCANERAQRVYMANNVIGMPILQRFRDLLNQSSAETRVLQIMSLERALGRKMQPILADVSKKVDTTYKAYNRSRNGKDKVARKSSWVEYNAAKQEYVDKNIGLENLWRELSLIFEVKPNDQNRLAELAAQYLMDGFPLEIYDGDAGIYRKTWVDRVLIELDKITKKDGKPARFFVLSVMGLQSSGKSTILNLMFGTRLQTSAGRCTRGVYMQLVPSDRKEYDYVILIDTEGLRSNEFEGLNEAEARDNRLATFGLLPADASILMVSNEDDRGLKEVLPMVLLAFKNSSVAEKSGGRMKTKMFFVYRSVDTNDRSKLKTNKQKLHDHLIEAAEEVSRMSATTDENDRKEAMRSSSVVEANDLLETVFSELRVLDDETNSDVRCMGNLKRGGMPPGDTPDWSYGEAVINLREHIHLRVVEDERRWEATNLSDWSEHLTLVWKCICTADFELNFKSCVEYNAYMQLQRELQHPRGKVNQMYSDVFREMEKEIREVKIQSENTSDTKVEESFIIKLDNNVEEVVHRETTHVKKMLGETKWQKWSVEKLEEWHSSCKATKRFYHRKVEDLVSGIIRFDKIVADSESSFKAEIVKLIGSGHWKRVSGTYEQKTQLFDKLFQENLVRLEKNHPKLANVVSERVTRQYSEIGISRELDLSKDWNAEVKEWYLVKAWQFLKGKKKKEKTLLDKLKNIMEKHLEPAKQYSDGVVSQVIKETRDAIDESHSTREEREKYHSIVKQKLIERMETIQNEWDEKHNVAAKFRSRRERLLSFFQDKAQGLETTDMLINDLQRILKDELKEAFKRAFISMIASEIGTKEWLLHWQVLRNFLDYHLLILLDKNKVQKAIFYVSNESNHFKTVIDALIQHAITKDGVAHKKWEAVVRTVNGCIPKSPESRIVLFLLELKRSLTNRVDAELADKVTSPMDCDNIDLELDMAIYEKKVKELRGNLEKMEPPSIRDMMSELVEGVKDTMGAVTGNDRCRPRCEESCPMCGSACFHKKGHNYDCATSRHDCVHQPQGLSGTAGFNTRELTETNCVESVQQKLHMRFDDGKRRVPYEKFDEEFKDWRKPETNGLESSIYVREYIFFKYQEELVSYLSSRRDKVIYKPCPRYNHDIKAIKPDLKNKTVTSGVRRDKVIYKPCPTGRIPPRYNHDIMAIKADLKNKLERSTPDLTEIERILEHASCMPL